MLLGPSLGTSTLVWEPAATRLSERYRVVRWDLPGHGRSPAATAPFTMAELALAVAALAEEAGADEPGILFAGVSMGGAVGLELLLARPGLVRAAAILCSGAVIGSPEGWRERARAARSTGTASLVVASAERWFAPGSMARDPDLSGRLLHSLRDADDESYALCCEALAGYDVRARLAEIATPVLAVWGGHDAVTPQASAAEIASGVPHGRLAGLPEAGHLAPAEQPAAVTELLTAFFEEHG
nr:alpha/beta fold hydrolase [Galbitalea soli]